MDIPTVIILKHQCESEIKAILKEFERQSGCTIGDILIEVVKVTSFGKPLDKKNSEIVDVHLDVRVNNER